MRKETPEHTIEQENGTVWINGKHNVLGRFSPLGFEIYLEFPVDTEVIGTNKTIEVRVKNTDEREWVNFKKLMFEHHNIDITDMEYPGGR